MLEPAFTSLKDFFSRTFLVSHFLPAFFFVLLNALLIALASEGIEGAVAFATDHLKIADLATAVAIATLIAIIVAFTLAPLLPAFTLLLEGKPLPGIWRRALIASARERGGDVAKQADAYRTYAATANRLNKGHVTRFTAAIAERPADAFDKAALGEAERSVRLAEAAAAAVQANADAEAFDPDAPIKAAAALIDAGNKLEAALKAHPKPGALPAKPTDEQRGAAARLETAQRDFSRLLGQEVAQGTALLRKAENRAARMMVAEDPQPTRFGNLRAQIQDHCRRVYKVEYDYVWPRLRLLIDAEEKKSASVEDAQAQFDFSLMMMMLLLVSALAWAVWLIATLDRPVTILATGIAAPLLLIFFYNVVLASQRKLNEITEAAIDRYRLKLLEELHAPAPAGYQAELKSWRSLQAIANGYVPAENFISDGDFTYKT